MTANPNINPTAVYAYKTAMTVRGDISTFDDKAFVDSLCQTLGVEGNHVEVLSKSAGSVVLAVAMSVWCIGAVQYGCTRA